MRLQELEYTSVLDMWTAIIEYRLHDPMTAHIFRQAEVSNLSREQLAMALAFYALRKAEALSEDLLVKAMTAEGLENITFH